MGTIMLISAGLSLLSTLIVNGVSHASQYNQIIDNLKKTRDANDFAAVVAKMVKEVENNLSTLNDIASENSAVLQSLKYFNGMRGSFRKIREQTIKDWNAVQEQISDQKSELNKQWAQLSNIQTSVANGVIDAEEGQKQMNSITAQIATKAAEYNRTNTKNNQQLGTDYQKLATTETSKNYNTKYRTAGGLTTEAKEYNRKNNKITAKEFFNTAKSTVSSLVTGATSDSNVTDEAKNRLGLNSDLDQTYTERR